MTWNAKESFADSHDHDVFTIFDVLPNFSFTTRETNPEY